MIPGFPRMRGGNNAPAIVGFRAAASERGNTVAVPLHNAGDFLIGIYISPTSSNSSPTTPGWSVLIDNLSGSGDPNFAIYTKMANGQDGHFTSSGSNLGLIAVCVYGGISGLIGNASLSQVFSGNVVWPALGTPLGDQSAIFIGVSKRGGSTGTLHHITTPTGMVKRISNSQGGSNRGSLVVYDSNGPYVSHGTATGFATSGNYRESYTYSRGLVLI